MGWREFVRDRQVGMGPLASTFLRSLMIPSPNISRRDVASDLMYVGTTATVLSNLPVDMMMSHMESPIKTQSPPLRTLLCCVYPPPEKLYCLCQDV